MNFNHISLILSCAILPLFAMEKPTTNRPYAICGAHLDGQQIETNIYDPTWTDLHDAAHRGNIPLLQKLIQEKKEVKQTIDPQDRFGQSPAWWAAKSNKQSALEMLLKNGASADLKDMWGRNVISLVGYSPKLLELVKKAQQK